MAGIKIYNTLHSTLLTFGGLAQLKRRWHPQHLDACPAPSHDVTREEGGGEASSARHLVVEVGCPHLSHSLCAALLRPKVAPDMVALAIVFLIIIGPV